MKNLGAFFSEVRQEMTKIVWPSKDEFIGSLIVVLITMVAFAIFLGFVNYVFHTGATRGFSFLVFGY